MKNFTHKILIPMLFSMSIVMQAFSQEVSISGKVTDGTEGLPGVTVMIKGSTTGTVTDMNGQFTVKAKSGDLLLFSFIGYATQEVAVGAQSVLDITMAEDATQLDEIVVIGYGETTVKDATGAVASVSAKQFNGGVISSPEQLIQGKTAGVQITSTSGAPGDGVQLRIRGTSSIRSNNNPLFVVDGVPLSGGTQAAASDVGFGTTGDTNPLNFINPSDIQSISILKDASSTAIYGSRGANGVVIITTKSGKGNKGSFEYASSVSIAKPANKYDLLDSKTYLKAVHDFGGDSAVQNKGSNTDWQDYVTRTAISHKQNLSYSKGFKTGSIRASIGYEDQQGVLKNSSMTRTTGRINATKSYFDKALNISLSSTISNVEREDPAISGNAGFQGDLLGAAYSANPTWPTDPDFVDTGGQRSPANMLTYFQAKGNTKRALTNISADYKIIDGLVAKATYGLDWSSGERVTLMSGDGKNAGNGVQNFGQGQLNGNKSFNNLVELTLNYNKKIGIVNVDVVGGYSFQSFQNQWFWAGARGFDDYSSFDKMESDLRASHASAYASASGYYDILNNYGVSNDLRNGTETTGGFVSGVQDGKLQRTFIGRPARVSVASIAGNFYDQTDYLQSYFARGNFTISDKYIITATIRADGSSKFGEDNKYGIFPSAAVAWKLHEEAFMPELFSSFKLRAGYGIVGNQDGLGYGEFIRRERWSDASVGESREIGVPGTNTQGSINPGLKWETTKQLAIGIDFGIFSEKLYGSFDIYNKQTTDLLLRYNVAQPALNTTIFGNLDAIVENKGWELALTYEAVSTDDLSFSVSGNVSQNKNMLKDFGGELDAGQIFGQGLTGAYAQRLAGGHPLFSYHLREFEGFDDKGQPIGDNQTYIGKSALPTWNTGLSLNARYKNFDLAVYFAGQFGHYIYNNTQNGFFTAGSINGARNVTYDVLTSGEAGSAEAAVSTRFLEKGDFIRLQNLSLGYTVPMEGSKYIKNLRFYVTGQNLLLITDYKGLDPEVSSNPADFQLLNSLPTAGIDYTAYPKPRTFTLGVTASF